MPTLMNVSTNKCVKEVYTAVTLLVASPVVAGSDIELLDSAVLTLMSSSQ